MKLAEIIDLKGNGKSQADIQIISDLDEFMCKVGMSSEKQDKINQLLDELTSQIKLMPMVIGKIVSAEDVSTEASQYCAATMANQVNKQTSDMEDYFLGLLKQMYSHLRVPDPLL